MSHIRGFSRETLNANIESREWRQQYSIVNQIPSEHPRSSTTDDVECFFSVLRDSVGKHFTVKEASIVHLLALSTGSTDVLYRLCLGGGKSRWSS